MHKKEKRTKKVEMKLRLRGRPFRGKKEEEAWLLGKLLPLRSGSDPGEVRWGNIPRAVETDPRRRRAEGAESGKDCIDKIRGGGGTVGGRS